MNLPCRITLRRYAGEKTLVSPEFPDGFKALDFRNELLEEFSYFMRFYPTQNKYLLYNDDYFLAIEPEEQCQHLDFDTYNAKGERLLEICLEAAMKYIENRNPSY